MTQRRFIVMRQESISVAYQKQEIKRHNTLFKTKWVKNGGVREKLELQEKFPKPQYKIIAQVKETKYTIEEV